MEQYSWLALLGSETLHTQKKWLFTSIDEEDFLSLENRVTSQLESESMIVLAASSRRLCQSTEEL